MKQKTKYILTEFSDLNKNRKPILKEAWLSKELICSLYESVMRERGEVTGFNLFIKKVVA